MYYLVTSDTDFRLSEAVTTTLSLKLLFFGYRNRLNGRIIRACDKEMTLSDSHEYKECNLEAGPKECIEPPDYTLFGYDSRIWDNTRVLLSKVTYVCDPPKVT